MVDKQGRDQYDNFTCEREHDPYSRYLEEDSLFRTFNFAVTGIKVALLWQGSHFLSESPPPAAAGLIIMAGYAAVAFTQASINLEEQRETLSFQSHSPSTYKKGIVGKFLEFLLPF
jgi:hypothetical protein